VDYGLRLKHGQKVAMIKCPSGGGIKKPKSRESRPKWEWEEKIKL